MTNTLRPYECGDRVKLFMLNDRYWHGKRGTLQGYNTSYKGAYGVTVYSIRMDEGQIIKCEYNNLILIDSNVKDTEGLPAVPTSQDIPKDGDCISNHKDHEVVTASAGGESYKYCRTCKIEVKEGSIPNKLDLNTATGQDLDELASLYGITRYLKTDAELRSKIRVRVEDMTR